MLAKKRPKTTSRLHDANDPGAKEHDENETAHRLCLRGRGRFRQASSFAPGSFASWCPFLPDFATQAKDSAVLSSYAFFTFTFASLLSFLCFLYFHSCFPCLLGRARFRQTCSFALGPFALASKCNVYALFACKVCLSKLTIKAIWFIS